MPFSVTSIELAEEGVTVTELVDEAVTVSELDAGIVTVTESAISARYVFVYFKTTS